MLMTSEPARFDKWSCERVFPVDDYVCFRKLHDGLAFDDRLDEDDILGTVDQGLQAERKPQPESIDTFPELDLDPDSWISTSLVSEVLRPCHAFASVGSVAVDLWEMILGPKNVVNDTRCRLRCGVVNRKDGVSP
jgi:hypothetical protein